MKIEKYIRISRIIALSYFKRLSLEQQAILENWLEETPENKKLYNKVKSGSNFSIREKYINELDKEQIWNNIYDQIAANKSKSIEFYKKFIRYAAILLIPLAITFTGWYIYNDIKSGLGNRIEIKPGKKMAKLVFNTGKEIELGKKDTLLKTRTNAVEIKINPDFVAYHQKKVQKQGKTEYHTLQVPKGGEYFLTLSDGTKVWVNADTELKFPSVFTGNERRVYLKGEALFEVAKDNPHPFIVYANGLNIKVLGTKFNVSAYPDDDFVHATLVEGKIFINEEISGFQQSAILEPSQQAFLSKSGTQELIVQTVDADIYTSWAEGKFIFRKEPLASILKKLGRWYNIEVFYDDANTKYLSFSAILPRFENCETYFALMEKTNSVKFEYTETTVLVKSVKKSK